MTVIVNWRDSSHPQGGGAELYCERLAEELGATGRRVVLLTSRPPGLPSHERRARYDVIRAGGTYGVYPQALWWLWRRRRQLADVIDAQNGIPFFTPLVVGGKTPVLLLIFHVHQDQFTEFFGPVMAKVGRFLEGPMSRVVYGRRTIVAISPSTQDGVRQALRLRGDVVVAACGMDAPQGSSESVVTGRAPVPTVVAVGRLVAHKRVDVLVRAMTLVRDTFPGARLDIVGDGSARPGLEELAASLPGSEHTTFHGRVESAERDRLMRAAWLTVSTSPGEGWGLSMLEANAAGVPAVAFRVNGLRDSVVPGRTGWLVEPGAGVDGLAAAISSALLQLSDAETAARYSADARMWARHFTWKATSETITTALGTERARLLLGRKDRRSPRASNTCVELRGAALAAGSRGRVRRDDQYVVTDTAAHLVLRGADASGATAVARRIGVDATHVSIRTAGPADVLGSRRVWPVADDRPAAISELMRPS